MLTLTKLRKYYYPAFHVMIDTGAYLDFAHGGKVYRLNIEDLGVKAPPIKRKRKRKAPRIKTEKCDVCNGVAIAGVCLAPDSHKA